MTDIPLDPTAFDVTVIPVEQVKLGYSLLVDDGEGPQVFRVGNVRFRSIQASDGSYVGTYLLASEPDGRGEPVRIEYPAGTQVNQILNPSGA